MAWCKSNPKKLNLVNWEMVCEPKKMGGLGVMDLGMFNEALPMKWLWQWIEPKQRLWKTIFKITMACKGLIQTHTSSIKL